nr:MAG TPA: hypothetical protein [Caudoviricetes sp.]DAU40800.1 MAG TPA: hypothetical protein [Caudoviricetes sp.]
MCFANIQYLKNSSSVKSVKSVDRIKFQVT